MNIKEAKIEIENTFRAYNLKNSEGKYLYPLSRQRPILLMGPPGIGKTAILEQIADECGVGLVAYSLTHHTRQSAVGLPHIEKLTFGGQEFTVTEYTMCEIIASVYQYMQTTGKTEGILFIDEVNCVSETLAPTMLQLLQNKTFGNHQVPQGWMIVTAGNPPEFNKSVREFDVATLDRVRTIPVEADCGVWMEYARERAVHSAILSYLTIRPDHFYQVEDRNEGKFFVTARGWEDLSELLKAYEALNLPVGKSLVSQFLQQPEVAEKFAAYYQLYRKYDEDYGIDRLLKDGLSENAYAAKVNMARAGSFEERFTVVRLMIDALNGAFEKYALHQTHVEELHKNLKKLKNQWDIETLIKSDENALEIRARNGLISDVQAEKERWSIERLKEYALALKREHIKDAENGMNQIRQWFSRDVEDLNTMIRDLQGQLSRAFQFAEESFGEGQEMVLFVSDLSHSRRAMKYISDCGCPEFLRHADALLFQKQERALMQECREFINL